MLFCIYVPTNNIIRESNLYYQIKLNEFDNFLTYKEAINQSINRGIVSQQELDELDIHEQQKKLVCNVKYTDSPKLYEDDIYKCYDFIENGFIVTDIQKQNSISIDKISNININELRFVDIYNRKHIYLPYTKEFNARKMQSYFIMQKCLKDINGNYIFKNVNDLLNINNSIFSLFKERFVEVQNLIPECIYRKIARGSCDAGKIWKLKWMTNQSNVFDSMDKNKELLIYWTKFYDSIYEDPEKPDDMILENDSQLDIWYFNRQIELKMKNNQSQGSTVITNINKDYSIIDNGMATFSQG